MLHLSTGLLQEYGIWQILTAGCFLASGIVLHAKDAGGGCLAKFCAILGVWLCVDEIMMLHECLDWRRPAHLLLSLEFFAALVVGVMLLRRGFFRRREVYILVVVAFLALAAFVMELWAVDQSTVSLEEGMEVVCAILALILAWRGGQPSPLSFRQILSGAVFWTSLVAVLSGLIFVFRPAVCPTVDYWSKKYFHEQIW